MVSHYSRLKEEWLLRGWTDVPWCLVNWKTGEHVPLTKEGFYVARSCDGQSDFDSMAFLPGHLTLLNKFIEVGIAEECHNGERLRSYQEYRLAENQLIRGIQWAVTGRCNLNCRHCYMEAPVGRQDELDLKDMEIIISQFEQANLSAVSLTGGEPFMRKDLLSLIEKLEEKKISLRDIYTNATFITEEILEKLRALGVSPIFRISFDGCGTHDGMRGTQGVESLVLDNICRIRAAGFEVSVTTSVDRTNLHSLMSTYERMKDLDLYSWGVGRPQSVGCGRELTTGLSLEELAEPCTRILYRWLEDGRPFMIGLEAFYSGAKHGTASYMPPASGNDSPDSYACSACREWPYLTHDGKLLPCIGYIDTALEDIFPNILDAGFSRALDAPSLRSVLDIKRGEILTRNPECASCEKLRDCGTGCRASALVENGSHLSKDTWACRICKSGCKEQFAEIVADWEKRQSKKYMV